MAIDRPTPLPANKQPTSREPRSGRTGEGSQSVLPYLRADQRARAAAALERRREREA